MTTEPKTFPQMPSMSMCATELVWATKLQDWGRAAQAEISSLASRLEASQALAGELAEALHGMLNFRYEANYDLYLKARMKASAALAKFRSSQPQA